MQGDCAARKLMSFPRVMRLRNTTWPAASAPCAWNTCFAMSNPIVVTCAMDASFSDGSTPSPWHADAVRGRPPCTIGASGKQKSYASQAGPPVGSDQRPPRASSTMMGHVPQRVGHDGCPVGSRASERQYRDRQASWRPVRSIGEDRMVEETIAWFAGVDWGSAKHQACLLGAQGGIVGEREFPHSGKGLSELADWILSMAGIASAVAVAVEVPHGPVVDVLLDRGFIVHAINPKQLDRLRDRFSIAGAKDDRRDAYVSADGLRTDRHLFRRLQIADPRLIELRAWSRLAEELQEERVRLSNRLHQQ